MVSLPQISKGIITFIEKELIIKANGANKKILQIAIPLIPQIVNKKFDEYKKNILLECFINENGIDIDELYKSTKKTMVPGENIVFSGIVLNETDIDNLYTYITNAIV